MYSVYNFTDIPSYCSKLIAHNTAYTVDRVYHAYAQDEGSCAMEFDLSEGFENAAVLFLLDEQVPLCTSAIWEYPEFECIGYNTYMLAAQYFTVDPDIYALEACEKLSKVRATTPNVWLKKLATAAIYAHASQAQNDAVHYEFPSDVVAANDEITRLLTVQNAFANYIKTNVLSEEITYLSRVREYL